MAVFLDPELSTQVSQASLISVVKHATKRLLDPRLAAVPAKENSGLDESTSKKMVKAINKVSI